MKERKIAYLYLVITFCTWGSYYVVSKFVLGKVPVLTILFLRYLIAGSILLFILKRRGFQKIEREDYKYILLIGFVGYFLSSGAQLFGAKLANASLASLINSMNPVFTMVFASFALKEKITVKKIVCIALAIMGVYIIIGGVRESGQAIGILLSVFAVISWAFAAVMSRKITQKYDAFQISTYTILIAVICNFPGSLLELMTSSNIQFDWTAVLSLLYLGIVCTAIGFVLWNKSLSMLEASNCTLLYPIQPMVSVLLGSIFLGETINMNFVFGAVLIIGGVVYSIIGKKEISAVTVSE